MEEVVLIPCLELRGHFAVSRADCAPFADWPEGTICTTWVVDDWSSRDKSDETTVAQPLAETQNRCPAFCAGINDDRQAPLLFGEACLVVH